MRILVTGGAGFIGSALCRYLVGELGHQVVNVDKLTYAASQSSLGSVSDNPRYRFVQVDICNRLALDRVFCATMPDAVIHLAAESNIDRSIDGAVDFVQTNVLGSFQLLEASRNYLAGLPRQSRATFRFLQVSTQEVHGPLSPGDSFLDQAHYRPSSPYSATKAAADHLTLAWYKTYGMPVIISHCCNTYGPYHFPEKLIPLIILNALEERELPVYGDGSNVRDWIYVEDCARALFLTLTRGRPGESYNIGGRNERTNLEVVEAICALLDSLAPAHRKRRELIRFVTDRPGHDAHYATDPSKAETELGWRAVESFDSGLAKTVRWYLDNEAWWRPVREHRYSGERLGLVPA